MLPTTLPTDFQPPTDCPGIPRLPTFQSKPRGCSHTLPPNPPPVGSWKSGPGRPSTFQTGVAREFLVGSGWKEAQRRPALMGSSLPNVPYPTKGLTARGSCDARFCRPSCTSESQRLSRTVSGRALDCAPPWRVITPPPQGSSLGSGLWCPGPSSLSQPHPSHSWAHRDFTAWRLIRDAFAVRERLGDPRVVPGFRCSFRPDMPPSLTPGSSIVV